MGTEYQLRDNQNGMSAGGWIFMVLVFGIVLSVGAKLAPLYLDNSTISGILDGLAEEQGLVNKRSRDIESMMVKRFKMNNIRDFNVKENIEIKRSKRGVDIVMQYEVRQQLLGNVDLVTSFEKQVSLKD